MSVQRAPAILALLLFVALCASLAYWLLQWFAPAPRPVAAPPEAARSIAPVAAASALFGGRPQDSGGVQVQLRGILQAGKASVAIIAAEGKPPRALRIDAEVVPGLTIKEIGARTVVLSGRGAERELSLPAFAAQEGGTSVQTVGVAAEPPPPQPPPQQQLQIQPQPSSPPQQPVPAAAPPSSAGASEGGSSAAGGGAAETSSPRGQPAGPQGASSAQPNRATASPQSPQSPPSAPAVPQLPRPPLR